MVQFSHGAKSDVSVFQLLYNTATVMLTASNRLQEEKLKNANSIFNVVYQRILWSKYCCVCVYACVYECVYLFVYTSFVYVWICVCFCVYAYACA